MKELFILIAHLLTTLAMLLRPGGVRAVAAESLRTPHPPFTSAVQPRVLSRLLRT
jgi:hypothetical protein